MKKINSISLLIGLFITFGLAPAQAANPKIGSACSPKDARVKVNNAYLHCAVIPDQWAKTKQLVWQNEEQWSAAVDKVINTLDVKTKYQYCLTSNGAPLPGQKGTVPSTAINACQGLPGAPKNSASNSQGTSNQSSSLFPSYITPSFLSCLTQNGFKPKDINELMMGMNTKPEAFSACKNLAPDFLASRIK